MPYYGNSPESVQLERQADALEGAAKGAASAAVVAAEASRAATTAARAAWVQAIGSIVGIAVAIAIPAYQSHRETKKAEEAEGARAKSAWIQIRDSAVDEIDILMDAKRQIQAVKSGEQGAYQFPRWMFDDARDGIRGVPFHLIDDQALLILMDVRQGLGEVRRLLLPLDGKRAQEIASDAVLQKIDAELRRVGTLGDKASKESGRYEHISSAGK